MARKSRKNTEGSSAVQVMPPKRVFQTAIYVRISVENERKIEADSIGTQIQMLKDFASQMPELSIYDVYCDDDITGTNFARPEFSRMMNDVRDRNVNCIMVKDLSRLGRNYLESGEYIEKVFPFFGIRFIAINDRIDTFEKPIDISVQLKNMANEMYAKDISKKIRSTMKSLQAQGKFIGSQPPYARKMDDLKIFMASLSRDALKYAPEYTGSEKWAKRVEAFQQQEQLSREMVEAFIDMITVYEDGRTEVAFRNMDELEAVLYQASERRKEDMRYAV